MQSENMSKPDSPIMTNRVKAIIREKDAYTGIPLKEKSIVEVSIEGSPEIITFETSDYKGINYFKVAGIPDAFFSDKQRKQYQYQLQLSVKDAEVEEHIVFVRSGLAIQGEKRTLVIGNKSWSSGLESESITLGANIGSLEWRGCSGSFCNYDDLIRTMLDVSPGSSEIMLAVNLVASMKPIYEMAQIPFEGIINFYGAPGIGKTSMIKAFTNILKDEEKLRASCLFETKRDIKRKTSLGFGFVICLDDFHPTKSDYDKKKQMSVVNAVARYVECDHHTAIPVLTSEYIDGEYSLQDRMIQVEVEQVDKKLLTKLQSSDEKIACFILDYIGTLMENYDEVIEYIKYAFSTSESSNVDISHRLERNAKFLEVATELCSRYLIKDNGKLVDRVKTALNMQAQKQCRRLKNLKQLSMGIDYIWAVNEMVINEVFQICSKRTHTYQALNNQVFVTDPGIMYIKKSAIRYGFQVFFGVHDIEMGRLVKAFQENDILIEDLDARSKKFFDGTRHLCINTIELEKYIAACKGYRDNI